MDMINTKELSIYIHIPFCVRKCLYCDFLSAPATDEIIDKYIEVLCNNMKIFFETAHGYKVVSTFIGGGTPSMLNTAQLEKVLNQINKINIINSGDIAMSPEFEFTIECNPGTLSAEKLKIMKGYGVNRLSLGLQSTINRELQMLGRIHTYEEFLESFHMAREHGFKNINIDLMSALPEQNFASWKETLDRVVKLNPEHISAYSLILEPGTHMYNKYKEGEPPLPDEDEERRMYHFTQKRLSEAGYERYEISNYARKGYESKHNIGYWTGREYIGFGVGAASYLDHVRYKNIESITDYVNSKDTTGYVDNKSISDYVNDKMHFCSEIVKLSIEDEMAEFMFLGLRMMDGVSTGEFENRFGRKLMEVYGEVISKQISTGMLVNRGDRLFLSKRGIDISNSLMCEYLS